MKEKESVLLILFLFVKERKMYFQFKMDKISFSGENSNEYFHQGESNYA
ncbi:hypothetical protein JOC86_000445 [Bacillus pakistanensis]|uniref:Uncharacterized protein n=1 Tax=Rossellomorea pakistanensis TaxID=992288 RepID=A0ABS2N7S5_9BACI|nr:hypothetical protein [Bacillus pakistanensis]